VIKMLPVEFADLQPFAETWSLATEPERWDKRMSSSMDDLLAFYDAAFPRLEAAVDHCDGYLLEALPEEATNLLYLVYSLILVSMAVEVFGQAKTVDSADAILHRIREPLS
jgi:hypothetical protein